MKIEKQEQEMSAREQAEIRLLIRSRLAAYGHPAKLAEIRRLRSYVELGLADGAGEIALYFEYGSQAYRLYVPLGFSEAFTLEMEGFLSL